MKPKKEIIILAVVMAAAVAYLALKKTDRTHFQLPDLPRVTEGKISKLEIVRQGKTTVLEKKDGKWRIAPQQWPADEAKVKGMLDIVAGLKLTALISESKSYARYDLDDAHRITVRAFAGDRQVRAFDVGKSAATYEHTHVRIEGDPNVYHARQDFRRRFDRSADDLRDLSVLTFETEEIRSIEVAGAGKTAQLTRPVTAKKTKEENKAGETAPWQSATGGAVDQKNLNSLISTLSRLNCEKFIDDKKIADFADPAYTLVLEGKKEYSLKIFQKPESGAEGWPAVSSASPYPFILSGYRFDSIKKNIDAIFNPTPPVKDGAEQTAKGPPSPST